MGLSNPSVRLSVRDALSFEPINFFHLGFRLMVYQGLFSCGIDEHPPQVKGDHGLEVKRSSSVHNEHMQVWCR